MHSSSRWLCHCQWKHPNPDSKVHGANMGPTWVLSAPDGPHVGPVNLAIREAFEWSTLSSVKTRKAARLEWGVHQVHCDTVCGGIDKSNNHISGWHLRCAFYTSNTICNDEIKASLIHQINSRVTSYLRLHDAPVMSLQWWLIWIGYYRAESWMSC